MEGGAERQVDKGPGYVTHWRFDNLPKIQSLGITCSIYDLHDLIEYIMSMLWAGAVSGDVWKHTQLLKQTVLVRDKAVNPIAFYATDFCLSVFVVFAPIQISKEHGYCSTHTTENLWRKTHQSKAYYSGGRGSLTKFRHPSSVLCTSFRHNTT